MNYLVQHFIDNSFKTRSEEVAIEQGNETFTYGQIDRLAEQFRIHFAHCGLRAGDAIGILSRVRAETIAGMIGALRSGIIYVPLNIYAPTKWIATVLRSANIRHLIYDPGFVETAGALRDICQIVSVLSVESVPSMSDVPPHTSRLADDIAYILYTSGSTGDPKGIMITHRNAFTFIDWMTKEFSVSKDDRILSRAPLQFDLSVFDIFSTLAAGGVLVIPSMDFDNSPNAVVSLMIEKKITIVYTVPSAYIGMLRKGDLKRGIPTLRWLLYAGEPFPPAYLREVMLCLPTTAVSNIYGPTETNIVTYHHLYEPPPPHQDVPIGRTVHDTEAYIVDENFQQVAEGEVGEILIRGGTVFAGYFNDESLTKERLIQSPFHTYPTLVCRTGDYGRWLPNGEIAYNGRRDNMVKVKGYRIEIGEVETALSRIEGVLELAVVARPHERVGNTLHAFVVLSGHTPVEKVKGALARSVPEYMIPFEYIQLDEMPKTATGKVDRVRLTQWEKSL